METKKIELYNDFIDAFMESLQLKKQNRNYEKELTKYGVRQQAHGLKMLIVSSDLVVEKYLEYRGLAQLGDKNYEEVFKAFAKLIMAMRQDVTGSIGRSYEDVLDILS